MDATRMVHKLMTEDEKVDIMMRAVALYDEGKDDEAFALQKTMPMPPFLAKFAKEHGQTDFLISSGWNLAEAEAAFGPDWLTN
jgi:hypothetical protein